MRPALGPRANNAESAEHAQKIRECFAILTQGVEMVHYDGKVSIPLKKKRIVWMDSDILRVCVDDKRPTLIDRAKGKMSPGLYMRDIAEVRGGDFTYDFRKNGSPPSDPDLCLALIGSERTISLELPGKMERDWFLERLQLVAQDILTVAEREEKERRKWFNLYASPAAVSPAEVTAANHMAEVLAQGVQIMSHNPVGQVLRSILTFDPRSDTLTLQPTDRSYLGFLANQALTVKVDDVVEIRLGTHSIGFVRTGSTDRFKECVSIVGTENVLDVQLANENARDVFAAKFRTFVMYHQLQGQNQPR